jgi:hypothetical protein
MTFQISKSSASLPVTLLAIALLSGCGANAVCQQTIDLAEECSGETPTAEERNEVMEACEGSFEDAEEIGPECYDGLMDLTSCIADLSCDDLDEYMAGEPGTTGYPCAAQDEVMYVDGVCS